ncbi:MAG: hypothetical protein K0B02_05110 [DPANN group archaeon]|nr:hypothetical protein [DPANN group archaeon]
MGTMLDLYRKDSLRYIVQVMLDTSVNIIFRGIHPKNLMNVLLYGIDRVLNESGNSKKIEVATGLNSNEFIYGSESSTKASEYVKSNPLVYLLYDANELKFADYSLSDSAYALKERKTTNHQQSITK